MLILPAFTMMYAYSRWNVVDAQTYYLAQRFFRVRKVEQEIHNVPRYSLQKMKDLAGLMHTSFRNYDGENSVLQKQLRDTQIKLVKMEIDMQLNEFEQQKYFQIEKRILDEIYENGNGSWKWSFEHRYVSHQITKFIFFQIK